MPDETELPVDDREGSDLPPGRLQLGHGVEGRHPTLLLDRDPTRGLKIPKEKNPERQVATHDRVDAIREQYRTPTMRVEWNGRQKEVESFLPGLFEIVVGDGPAHLGRL